MKRTIAIISLFVLLFNYTGLQLCLDFCGNQLEAIHFGEDEDIACHLSECCTLPAPDCCDSEQIQLEPHLFDYTVSNTLTVYQPLFEKEFVSLFDTVECQEKGRYTVHNEFTHLFRVPVRCLTQVTRC